MPNRALSLNSATAKRIITCLKLLSSSRKQTLGPPSSDPALWGPHQPQEGSGGTLVAALGARGCRGPARCRCRSRSLPAGHRNRICGRRSCRGRARGEKAFKGDA